MTTISIIVPIYKVEKYIDRCIISILNQTHKNIEVILVNDGSPDNCGKICDEYAKKDCRIKVIHKANGGLSDARNSGLDIATGKYIGFVDSDDYIASDMYENLLSGIINNSTDISMCGRYDVYDDKIKESFSSCGFIKWSNNEAIRNLLLWKNIDSAAWDKLYDRKLFNNIRFPFGKYNEDVFIMCNIIHRSNGITHIGKPKYYYNHRDNSITTEKFSKRKMDLIDANTTVLDLIKKEYPYLLEEAYSFYYKGFIYLLLAISSSNQTDVFKEDYVYMKNILRRNFMQVIKNQYIGRRNKRNSILILTNTYFMMKIMKEYVK